MASILATPFRGPTWILALQGKEDQNRRRLVFQPWRTVCVRHYKSPSREAAIFFHAPQSNPGRYIAIYANPHHHLHNGRLILPSVFPRLKNPTHQQTTLSQSLAKSQETQGANLKVEIRDPGLATLDLHIAISVEWPPSNEDHRAARLLNSTSLPHFI
jgi:hypothetical protein